MHWHVVASDTLAHTLSLTFPHRRDRGHAHSTRSPPLPLAIDRCNLLTSGKISVYISLHVSLLLLLCSVSYLIRRASQCRLYIIGCHNGYMCTTSDLASLSSSSHRSRGNSFVTLERSCVIRTGWSICSDNWIGLTWILAVPGSARADGKLAEVAEQLGKIEEHHRSKSTQPNYPTRWDTLHYA